MFSRAIVAAFVVVIVSVPTVHAQSDLRAMTVLDGVYSNAQAERGKEFYTIHCITCHGGALEGISAPSLKGNRFIERWREGMLDALYDFIRQRMPFGRPANAKPIPDGEYLDILTYVLNVNGYQGGSSELTPARLERVMLVGMSGPQPVPDGSHVVAVGCLSRVGDGPWILSNASEPARAREDDLKTSPQKTLGTLRFVLTDFEAIPDFSPSAHDGHKVQVKGFLTRQPNAERISLTAIEMLGVGCGG